MTNAIEWISDRREWIIAAVLFTAYVVRGLLTGDWGDTNMAPLV